MLNGISIILLILNWLPFAKDEPQFQSICEKEINVQLFSTDHLNNLYAVDNNVLVKLNTNCTKEKSYSQSAAYTIDAIDVSDPLKILIFNKDYNQLVFLNNQLAEITDPISFDNYGYYAVSGICTSSKGGFWIFDQSNLQLVYFNRERKEQKKSARLVTFFDEDHNASEIYLHEKNDHLYLGIPEVGILLFDLYGSYIKTFPVKIMNDFQVVNQTIIHCKSNHLHFYDTQTLEQESFGLPVENVINARVENQYLYIQKKNKLFIYQWQTNK
ncbi:MAG TPA: hypothetical protein VJ896_07460 [Bacteroidales bacterium]|nr:hypothetical protein [Bacteroidales bacterium]